MANNQKSIQQSIDSTNIADLLERILDKGIVIAGDIKIKLIEVELLTIQIQLVICSVDKAKEIGIDWWNHDRQPESLEHAAEKDAALLSSIEKLNQRIATLEAQLAGNSVNKTVSRPGPTNE